MAAVVDLFSRRVVGWSMSKAMTARLVTDVLTMAIWQARRSGAPLRSSSRYTSEPFSGTAWSAR
jgi:putative transposase